MNFVHQCPPFFLQFVSFKRIISQYQVQRYTLFRYQVLKVMFLTEKKIMENKLGCASVKLLV